MMMPWDVVTSDPKTETPKDAARRHGVRLATLRAKAKAIAGLRRGMSLPPHEWDRVASACVAERGKRGPKADLIERRASQGRESCHGASVRLGVPVSTLYSRAMKTGTGASRPMAEWDRIAVGMRR